MKAPSQYLSVLRWVLPPARVLRLSTYLTVVFLCCSAIAARAVYGQAKEAALALGHELSGLQGLDNERETVLVNGERFARATAVSSESLSAVLDEMEANCEDHPGLIGRTLAELGRERPKSVHQKPLSHALAHGVIREERTERGMIVCFSANDDLNGSGGKLQFLAALKRFSESSKLSEFGRMRYVFAESKGNRTYVSVLWAQSELDLKSMFPATGDAAGEDSRVVPRPPDSRRTLAASTEDRPYGVRVYESSRPRAAMQRYYDAWMRQHGWQVAGQSAPDAATAYLSPDGYQLFLTLSEADQHTFVTLTESGRADGTSIATVQVSE